MSVLKDKYISDYTEGFTFEPYSDISYDISGIKVTINECTHESERGFRQKANVTLKKGDAVYEIVCVDKHRWDKLFFPVTFNGKNCLCFRKTLYGFTILNVETLTEEFDYFPKRVLDNDEAFIIVNALSFGNYLIFEGCYWGCPYSFVAYDPSTERFCNLIDNPNFQSDKFFTEDSRLHLIGTDSDNETVTVTLTLDDIRRMIDENGKTGL